MRPLELAIGIATGLGVLAIVAIATRRQGGRPPLVFLVFGVALAVTVAALPSLLARYGQGALLGVVIAGVVLQLLVRVFAPPPPAPRPDERAASAGSGSRWLVLSILAFAVAMGLIAAVLTERPS